MPVTLETETRKAKKEHHCDFCGLKIEVGETYEDQTNVYDGELHHWKSHLDCQKLTKELNMYAECDEGLSGDAFQEYVNEFLSGKQMWANTWSERIAKAKEMLLIANTQANNTRTCVSHHHACDCGDERFRRLESAARGLLTETGKRSLNSHEQYVAYHNLKSVLEGR